MSLKRISYCEFKDGPLYWEIKECDFVSVNLVVGVNATGKTRFLNVLNGICRILSGKSTAPYASGSYDVEVLLDGEIFKYKLEFADLVVVKEELRVGDTVRMTRNRNGKGKIYYAGEKKDIGFQVPGNIVAIQHRRDTLQHPFIVKLAQWAETCELFSFANSFSNNTFTSFAGLRSPGNPKELGLPGRNLVKSYIEAFEAHKEPLDRAIIRDMKSLGYELVDVGARDLREMNNAIDLPEPILGMYVVERQYQTTKKFRDLVVWQQQMSQGMYRALALVIYLNISSLDNHPSLFLVDDIGEGLDYERSSSIVDLLIQHAKASVHQLIMTSNDRFVMNRVPLEYWNVLHRKAGLITAFTPRSHPKEFKDFEFMGLSNFDFFKSNKLQ